MRRSVLLTLLALATVVLLWAQRDKSGVLPAYEIKSVFPQEAEPGHYRQVEQRDLDLLAGQGWELVSVMPYVYRNEERGSLTPTPRPMVTQTYPAFFFKRLKPAR